MGEDLYKDVMLERVELIARLASDAICMERDREIALNLIVDILNNRDIREAESYSSLILILKNNND
ncbi:hypothetical protein [Erwinia sp. Leaf53]|uniref:hypothetical protein n=1 Tax=Erwinia sp. Leaf53 TaxID=1736225 RepID=UPI001F1B00B5|nr:hypothetical protein [Erwinia sp. Leaf53]